MSAPDPSKLDLQQIMQRVYDEARGTLRTDSTAVVSNVSIAVDMDPNNDGVYIADKTTGNKLVINADGSINIVTSINGPGIYKNIFNERLSIASGSTINLVTYTVPAGKIATLGMIFVSGENIAKYEVFINGIKIDCARTYFGGSLNTTLNYTSNNSEFTLSASDNLVVTVMHNRPSTADFQGRIQITEIG